MDVNPHPEIGGQSGRSFEGLVAAGEGGVDADHARAARLDEALVLGETPFGAVGAVAVGDAVCHQQPHPDLGARFSNDVEAAFDGVG